MKYIIYRDPCSNYEKVIERFCLRYKKTKPFASKNEIHKEAQRFWKENFASTNETKILDFLKLQAGEKPFVRCDKNGTIIGEKTVKITDLFGPSQKQKRKTNQAISASNVEVPPLKKTKEDAPPVVPPLRLSKDAKTFIQEMCPSLITPDVLNNEAFMKGMNSSSENIRIFKATLSSYIEGKQKERKSKLIESIEKVEEKLALLRTKMENAGQIRVSLDLGLSQISMLSSSKNSKLLEILALTTEISSFLKKERIVYKMKKRISQQGTTKIKEKNTDTDDLQLICYNSLLTWQDAYLALEKKAIIFPKSISVLDLFHICSTIEKETFVDDEIISKKHPDVLDFILQHFPVMYAKKLKSGVLMNIRDLLLVPDLFVTVNEEKEKETAASRVEVNSEPDVEAFPVLGAHKKRGRKPLHESYPNLITVVTDFIKQHSFSAHSRRRESTGTGTGVSLKDIQEHVMREIPELKEKGISRDCIHLLMHPPRKNSSRAARYKELVDARVPGKKNNYREESANQHFLFSRVSYREEFVSKFNSECSFFSCDDMNKIKMGPAPAVSRYHQVQRFFSSDDQPNLGDHDFPNPGYLILCSGYQSLEKKETENKDDYENFMQHNIHDTIDLNEPIADEEDIVNEKPGETFFFDKLNRKHYSRFISGPLRLVLRAVKFSPSSAQNHCNDMLPLLTAQVKDGKGIAFLKVDNGPDWNLHNIINEFFFCRLFKTSGLDILGIVSYAARYSAYNNIEHSWSHMSNLLTSVILPSVLDGDQDPPSKQSSLSEEERTDKEAEIFDNAMMLIKDRYWKNAVFNDSEVRVDVVKCKENEHPFGDYEEMHKIISGPIGAIRSSNEVVEELRFMAKHIDRKSNEVIFRKCVEPRCTHCSTRPVISKKAWDFLKERDFKWPNPMPSMEYPGHYMTFQEIERLDNRELKTGETNLPRTISIGSCPFCPQFVFLSAAEKTKHMSVLHHGKKVKKTKGEVHRCLFIIHAKDGNSRCNLAFENKNKLKEHKSMCGHIKANNPKKNSRSKGKETKKKQLRIDEVVMRRDEEGEKENDGEDQSMVEIDDDEEVEKENDSEEIDDDEDSDEGEEDEENEGDNNDNACKLCGNETYRRRNATEDDTSDEEELDDWVCCDRCHKWYHSLCARDEWPMNKISRTRQWFCCK